MMMDDGNSGILPNGVPGGTDGFDFCGEEDLMIDMDMVDQILQESDSDHLQSQQEDLQNVLYSGVQVGSIPDSGNQVNFLLPNSADISSSVYETVTQSRHVEGATGLLSDHWIDNSNISLVCDALMENDYGVSESGNGTDQLMNMLPADAAVILGTGISSMSSFSHNSDLTGDFDRLDSGSAYFPQFDPFGRFISDTLPGSEAIMSDGLRIFPTVSFEGAALNGFDSERHGSEEESYANFKFGSCVYNEGHEETSVPPFSSFALGLPGKPPVLVHPKQLKSVIASAMLHHNDIFSAEENRGFSRVARNMYELPAIPYPTSTRPPNLNFRDLHFASMQPYGTDNNQLHGGHDELIFQKSFGSHFSGVSLQSTPSSSSGSQSVVGGESDLRILVDASQPPTSSQSQSYQKPSDSLKSASHSVSHRHPGTGGMRRRGCDDRVLFRVALQDLNQPMSEASLPDGLMAVPLLRHQRIALSWMVQKETSGFHCSGGILADDQGLGKTISTIALILKERSPCHGSIAEADKNEECKTLDLDDEDGDENTEVEGTKTESTIVQVISNQNAKSSINLLGQSKGRPAAGTLIVCPTSVLRQWAEELHKKVTAKANLTVLIYHGSNRTKDPHELSKYDVVLTTYSIVGMEVPKQPFAGADDEEKPGVECDDGPHLGPSSKKRKYLSGKKGGNNKETDCALFETLARPLAKVGWFRVVLDEAQSIKNHKTQVARACWGLRAKRRWCLSGTPLQNAIDDLYSYFRFLRYDPYTSYPVFCNGIKVPIQRDPVLGYRKLQAVLKTVMLRRTKGTMIDGEPIIILPPKTIELKRVEFTDDERCFYSRLESDSRAQFKEYAAAGTLKQNYVNMLLMLLRLRQACDHPLLVRGYESVALGGSSTEMAKKLPPEQRICLLNCLEASLAICDLCNDPPEDAVVSVCGHVFCNQCISEHLNGDDNQCPNLHCKTRLNTSSVLSKAILLSSLADQSNEDVPVPAPDDAFQELVPRAEGGLFESSKIRAVLAVLQSISLPQHCVSEISCRQNPVDPTLPENSSASANSVNNDNESNTGDNGKLVCEKAIVFSQWTRMLDLLEACLKPSSIEYRRLDGTMSVAARDKAVKDFNTLPEVSVIIMSLKAASLGLNMVSACHVLLLDLWWNPTTEDQAIDRAHRIGQTRPVTVFRLTVKDTVEDRILALQQKKREMVASALGEDGDGGRQTRLTEEDLKYLFMG